MLSMDSDPESLMHHSTRTDERSSCSGCMLLRFA